MLLAKRRAYSSPLALHSVGQFSELHRTDAALACATPTTPHDWNFGGDGDAGTKKEAVKERPESPIP
jgi:hypothetical protein